VSFASAIPSYLLVVEIRAVFVRPMTGVINEPRQATIGDEQMRILFVLWTGPLPRAFSD
jgi:hypothetical protein